MYQLLFSLFHLFNVINTIFQQAAEISAYHGFHFPKNKGNNILSVVDKFINSEEATASKNKKENAEKFESDVIGEEEQKFLQEFIFLKGYDGIGNGAQDEESSLKNRLKTISRPKSFDVKKSFTDDVSIFQNNFYLKIIKW